MFKRNSSELRRRRRPAQRSSLKYYRSTPKVAEVPPPAKRAKWRQTFHKLLKHLLDSTIVIIILVLLIYSLIVVPKPKLSATSYTFHKANEYQAVASQSIGHWSNRNKITFDKSSVLRDLQKHFPEVKSAEINLPLFSHQPSVKLTVAVPTFRLASSGSIYLLDDSGVVVANAAQYPALAKLPLVTDQSGFPAQIGKIALDTASVNFVNQLLLQLKKANIPVGKLVLPPKAEELDFTAGDKSYYVRFYLAGEAQLQIGQYLAARHHFNDSGGDPKQYLDVRVAGKVFYK